MTGDIVSHYAEVVLNDDLKAVEVCHATAGACRHAQRPTLTVSSHFNCQNNSRRSTPIRRLT